MEQQEPRDSQVTAYMTATERSQLQQQATAQRITLSTLIGKILAQWLTANSSERTGQP